MLKKLSKNIYVFPADGRTDRPNIVYIQGSNHALLFDAGASPFHAGEIQKALESAKLAQPTFIALSHAHWDHSFALSSYSDTISIASYETNKMLKEMSTWSWAPDVMTERLSAGLEIKFCHDMLLREYGKQLDQIRIKTADIVYNSTLSMDLGGGVVCELIHIPVAPHGSESTICLVKSDDVYCLCLGDANSKDFYQDPHAWNSYDPNIPGSFNKVLEAIPCDEELISQFMAKLETLDFEICIPGHKKPMARKDLFHLLKNA